MPTSPRKAYAYPGCHLLTDGSWCKVHTSHSPSSSQYRGSAASRGYDSNWNKVRSQRLKLDKYLCQNCLPKRVTPASEVHHLRKIATHPHLRLAIDNLLSVCHPCHALLEPTAE